MVRLREDRYTRAHPTPAEVLLIIEISDSSLAYDREVKAHIYGRNGIPETWVKNLPEDCIERFTEPGPEGYARHAIHHRGETLTPVSFPDMALAWTDLLPPRSRWRKKSKVPAKIGSERLGTSLPPLGMTGNLPVCPRKKVGFQTRPYVWSKWPKQMDGRIRQPAPTPVSGPG